MTDKDIHKSPFSVVEGGKPAPSAEEARPKKPVADNDEALMIKISQLEQEHRDMDAAISTMEERMPYERITLQRLKKRKLILKDMIVSLKDQLTPDIIA